MTGLNILLIEDDVELAGFIEKAAAELGWRVDHQARPKEALLQAGAGAFDALILDRMLPEMDGLSVLKLLRGAGVETPVIMLTAMGGIDDRVDGLEAGADDYLVKPFAMSELIARLKSIARRQAPRPDTPHREMGDLSLDRLRHEAMRAGQPLDLSPLEFKLLDILMEHPGEVVTRTMLLEKVWGYSFDPKTSLVQTHMSRLRAKVDKPFGQDLIRTVRGAGYMLSDE
ncbi:MAG: response regulator transcription factor [Pseudomonadota bacterium]